MTRRAGAGAGRTADGCRTAATAMAGLNVLFLCTGNSCRSQMAEGFARAMHPTGTFYSAGTAPAGCANPRAVTVMLERGIDISGHKPKHLVRDVTSTGVPLDYVRHRKRCRDANFAPTVYA
jgi:hypothetical protein